MRKRKTAVEKERCKIESGKGIQRKEAGGDEDKEKRGLRARKRK